MLHMVAHVPIQVAVEPVHVDGAAVQAVIEHVLGQPGVLGVTVNHHQPGSVNVGQTDKHEGQNTANVNGKGDQPGIDQHINACPGDQFAVFRFRNISELFRRQPASQCRKTLLKYIFRALILKTFKTKMLNRFAGRCTTISGSRPTMIVSL